MKKFNTVFVMIYILVVVILILGSNASDYHHHHYRNSFSIEKQQQWLLSSGYPSVRNLIPPSVYHALGPFPIGTRELGSDVMFSFIEDIDEIWHQYIKKNISGTWSSELADSGRVGWKKFVPDNKTGLVQIIYDEASDGIRWDFMGNTMGLSVLQFYSWIFANFHLNSSQSQQVLINCFGCGIFYVDGVQYAGDRYKIGYGWIPINIFPGEHTLKMRLGGMQSASFSLQYRELTQADKPIFFKSDSLIPSLVLKKGDDIGHITGEYIGLSILNTGSDILKSFTVKVMARDKILPAKIVSNPLCHPGQTVVLVIQLGFNTLVKEDSILSLEIKATNGLNPLNTNITLPIVAENEPFLFTYLDFDHTVQFAMAMAPKHSCADKMDNKLCPIIFATHGAGSRADWLISAFRQQDYAWVIVPSGRRRYGYDWTAQQLQSGYKALESILLVLTEDQKGNQRPDFERILFTGHSMGGHGCYITSTRNSDYAVAVMCAAGWTTFHQYIAYYTRSDYSFIDGELKAILENFLLEYNPDLYMENLKGVPFITRTGGNDEDVNPWHPRRMIRLYNQISASSGAGNVSEVPGKPHWFDGIMDDVEMQKYYDTYLTPSSPIKPILPKSFVVSCVTPKGFYGRGGIQIMQHVTLNQISKIRVARLSENVWNLMTSNVQRFGFKKISGIPIPQFIKVDNNPNLFPVSSIMVTDGNYLCRSVSSKKIKWSICSGDEWKRKERSPETYGPMRQVFENPFVIIVGTRSSSSSERERFMEFAVFLANQMYIQGHMSVSIYNDIEWKQSLLSNKQEHNLVLIGGPHTNFISNEIIVSSPIKYLSRDRNCIYFNATNREYLFNAKFNEMPFGALFMIPVLDGSKEQILGKQLALVVSGTDLEGFNLAADSFPLYSGLQLPDYLILNRNFKSRGSGGIVAAGYWDNEWKFSSKLGYIDECWSL